MKIVADGAWSQFLTSDDLPASNPPWGYISKLDLVSGKILWNEPVGDINIDGKKAKVGTVTYGGLATNGAGILFSTGTEDSKAYALDTVLVRNYGPMKWMLLEVHRQLFLIIIKNNM